MWGSVNVEGILAIFYGRFTIFRPQKFLKPQLTVLENLQFLPALQTLKMLLMPAINFFELEEFLNRKVSTLSAGLQKECSLPNCLLCPSTIWILDEPSINLDKKWREKNFTI